MNKETYVIGGGITGLSIAYILVKAGRKVTLLEASSKEGGLLGGFNLNGEPLEHFYHHFFSHDNELHWMIKSLDIEDKVIYNTPKMGFFSSSKMYSFNGIKDVLSFSRIPIIGRVLFLITSAYLGFIANWRASEHISALQWLKNYSGRKTRDAIWLPLFNSKFGSYAEEIPLSWLVGRLRQRIKSRKNGDEILGYFDGGFGVLTKAIMDELNRDENFSIYYNCPIKQTEIVKNRITRLNTNIDVSNANVVFALPQPILHQLCEHTISVPKTEYFGAVCVVLLLKHSLSDIYWLNIGDANIPFGGVIEHTNFIPKEKYGGHVVYLSRYFSKNDTIADQTEEEIEKDFLPHLQKINPSFTTEWIIEKHVFRSNYAAPVINFNFSDRITPYKLNIDNGYAVNMTHVYPDERSTNNSIRIALDCCQEMGVDVANIHNSNSLAGHAVKKRA